MITELRLIFSSLRGYDYSAEEQECGDISSIKFTDNTSYNDLGWKSNMVFSYDKKTKKVLSIQLLGDNILNREKIYIISNLKFERREGPIFLSVIDDTQPIIIGALDIKDIVKSMNETTNVGYGDNSPIITNDKGNLIISKDIEIQR